MRSNNFLNGSGDNLDITDSGLEALGGFDPLPTGADLLAHWLHQLGKAEREALRVMRAAHDLSGDVTRAIFWYRNEPLPPFGYKTAEQLVSEGRTEDVLRYVASLEAGAAG